MAPRSRSPKDTFITIYGRKPVLEALGDDALQVDKVVLADEARGEPVRAIIAAARARAEPVPRASAHRVKVLSGNGTESAWCKCTFDVHNRAF